MKRRDFLCHTCRAGLAAAAGAIGGLPDARKLLAEGPDPSAASADPKAKIVLIGHKPDHPPGTHLYLKECRLLAKCLRQTAGVEAVVSDGWPRESSLLEGVAAVVLYSSPGAELLFRKEHAQEAEALLKRGVGFTALHWATGIATPDEKTPLADRYLAALGGIFGFGWSKLKISPAKVEPAASDHPICRGWSVFDLKDEWYLDLRFRPGAKPIAKVRVDGKDQVVTWAYHREDSGGGRSYGNTLGHFHENFGRESLRKMIVNGILWTAHREIPPGGAPCQIDRQDMTGEKPRT